MIDGNVAAIYVPVTAKEFQIVGYAAEYFLLLATVIKYNRFRAFHDGMSFLPKERLIYF